MKAVRFASAMGIVILATVPLHAVEIPERKESPGGEPYLKEQWPKTRCLVWEAPGEGGDARSIGNWTEYATAEQYAAGLPGRSAASPPDANTDLVLPDAPGDKPYIVGFLNSGRRNDAYTDPPGLVCRHVTIGKGAGLDGAAGSSRGSMAFSGHPDLDAAVEIHGNVTINDGGYIYAQLVFAGRKHTCFRVNKSPEPLATRIKVRKQAGASVLFLARKYDLVKGVAVETGRLELGPSTRLGFNATRQARKELGKLALRMSSEIAKADMREEGVFVHKRAVLEMHPGSSITRIKAAEHPSADVRIEGLLRIAPTEGDEVSPATIELCMAEGEGGFLEQSGGLYIRSSADVRNDGRLIVTASSPHGAATAKKGISVFLEKLPDFGDVSFDYLRAGGIVARDPAAARSALAHASFGQNCATEGEALFARLNLIDFQGGFGTVEFVDGLKTDCEILYPLAGRLIVRGQGNRTVQSFDLKSVHAVTIDNRQTEYSARRPLRVEEQQLRKLNALWSDVPGPGQIGKYGSHPWDKAPLLVWRHPGESGSRFVGANWLDDNGVPWFESPMDVDPNVDILLPASESFYTAAGFGSGGMSRPVPCRHLTIERNAEYGSSFDIRGNLWMKHASGIRGRQLGCFDNDGSNVHRFMRLDGKRLSRSGKDGEPLMESEDYTASQWGSYETGPDATLEVIGAIRGAADHSRVHGVGMLIMSEGSFLTEGERSAFSIAPGATVVLLQDARIGHETTMQQDICKASVWVGGTLMIGTPERPITHDMLFPVAGVVKDLISRDPAENQRTAGVSLLVGKQGRLVIHSTDPAKARVIFKMHDSEKAKARGARYGHPEGIALYFAGHANLNGVVFDNVHEGGIMVSPEQRATWKNVFYGEHNLAARDKLHWDLKTEDSE